ncbi:MAG: hypothetical protein ACK5WZ_08860 [Pseudobdellovibrionaceae bacterium]
MVTQSKKNTDSAHITKCFVFKSSLFIPLALSLMGNQSCEQSQNQQRVLKKLVGMDTLKSQPISLPDGGKFDFAYVMNYQAYGVLDKENLFLDQGLESTVDTSKQMGEKVNGLSVGDQKMLGTEYERDALAYKIANLQKSSTEVACFLDHPQFRLNGRVYSFEATSSFGLGIGFSDTGPISGVFPGANVEFDTAQLAMGMMAYRPELGAGKGTLKAINLTKDQTKVKVKFTLIYSGIGFTPSAEFKPSMAKVAEGALTKGIQQLKASKEMIEDKFYTRVLEEKDYSITIKGGRNLGIQKGDRFEVQNERGQWSGEPCASEFKYSVPLKPLAIIEIESVGDVASQGRVLKPEEGGIEYSDSARIGAKVLLHSFAQPPTAKK